MDIFPTPIYHVPVPQMEQHHQDLLDLFNERIKSGKMKAGEYGHGYQTPPDLFQPNAYGPKRGYLAEILGAAFCDACEEILYAQRNDSVAEFVWVNTMTWGWAHVQTAETLATEPPWHTHLPAQLSGCYYVSTATSVDEGNLQFLSPGTDTIFQPQSIEVVPRAGHMIIFPSYLKHKPTPSPTTTQTRIALCMDSHWTVQGTHQVPPEMLKNIPKGSEYGKR